MHTEHEEVRPAFTMPGVVPVLAELLELEADDLVTPRGYVLLPGEYLSLCEAVFAGKAAVDCDVVAWSVGANDVFLVCKRTSIGTEEHGCDGGVVSLRKLVVWHREPLRIEALFERTVGQSASTPTRIDEFPLAAVNPDCVPGVRMFEWW